MEIYGSSWMLLYGRRFQCIGLRQSTKTNGQYSTVVSIQKLVSLDAIAVQKSGNVELEKKTDLASNNVCRGRVLACF